MSKPADVLIVGGGVIGLTTAWYLTKAGARVTLLDQGEIGQQASWAGAGILSPLRFDLARSSIEIFRAHSVSLFPALSAELRAQTGIDNGHQVCGGLEVPAEGQAAPDEEWGGHAIDFQVLEGAELGRFMPGLTASIRRAYYFPTMAQVRNPRHVKALRAACICRGADLRAGWSVHGFAARGGRLDAIQTDQGDLSAERYLIAAGAWSDKLLEQAGWRPGIVPVRGQIALLAPGTMDTQRILMVGKRYVVPRDDGRVLIGSTEEHAGFDARPTAGAIAELLHFVSEVMPPLASAPLERCWAGLRPGSPDGLPFLGRVPGWENLFVAAGHYRSGIQLSPATGLVMSEMLLGRSPSLPTEPFRPDRIAATAHAPLGA